MHKELGHTLNSIIRLFLVVLFTLASPAFTSSAVNAADIALEPTLSADGSLLFHGIPTLVLKPDGITQTTDLQAFSPSAGSGGISESEQTAANFTIAFMAPGAVDEWGKVCLKASEDEKSAVKKGVGIWAGKFQLTVPITVQVCLSDFGSNAELGVSGGGTMARNFSGAPLTNTWYASSLANNLHGSDLDPDNFDIHITLNTQVYWYLGVDGMPAASSYDMPTVVAQQVAHGLNFQGTARFTEGDYRYGMDGSPDIYDTFMEAGDGTRLTSLGSPSPELAALLTSGDLWFNGTNANAANGDSRVKIYAPLVWEADGSYSHLDDVTFSSTPDSLMVSVIPAGIARHEPGPVTLGILKDLGWVQQPLLEMAKPLVPQGLISDSTPTFRWTKIPVATKYQFRLFKGTTTTPLYTITTMSGDCGLSFCTNTPPTTLGLSKYAWQVRAYLNGTWKAWSEKRLFILESPSKAFTSLFTSDAAGWTPIAGTWKVGSGDYRGASIPGKFVSSRHSSVYGIFTYTVKMRTNGCMTCSHGIYFNADPYTLGSGNQWNNGYALFFTNTFYYTLGMYVNGVWAPLIPWRKGSDLTSASNEVKITYHKETGYLQVYFNGSRSFDAILSTYRTGVVGLAYYDNTDDNLFVDYAKLSLTAEKYIPPLEGIISDTAVLLAPFEMSGSDMESPR